MKERPHIPGVLARIVTRWHLLRAGFTHRDLGFVSDPEPRTIGDMSKGQDLVAGRLQFTGHQIDLGDQSPWSQPILSDVHVADLFGFAWLDDLAALGDGAARECAQRWFIDWNRRYGRGQGPGWGADVTARRLIRLVNNAHFLQSGWSEKPGTAFQRSLLNQTVFLSKSWPQTPNGLPRIEAVSGLICAGLVLDGTAPLVGPALEALIAECDRVIDRNGGVATRNPEELLEVFSLLIWVQQSLTDVARDVPQSLSKKVQRIAPVLRHLRHGDGSLARFHGGGKGADNRLDQTLVASGVRASAPQEQAMGFVRISSAGTTLIADAAAPPNGVESLGAHASTNAFELTSGRQRLIVNCGSGVNFGDDWRLAGRATPSHSTLAIEGMSSSRFGGEGRLPLLTDVPDQVQMKKTQAIDGVRLQLSHNGYQATHGLVHARTLDMTLDGKGVVGDDEIYAPDSEDVDQFHAALRATTGALKFFVRFHLHPDVDPELDLGGAAISLNQPNGDVWVFRHDGSAGLSLEPSVYLEQGLQHPRPTHQIVLTCFAKEITTQVKWSLAKLT